MSRFIFLFFIFLDKCMFNLHGWVQRVYAGGLPCRSRRTWKASSVAAASMSRQTRWQIVPAAWEPPEASCSSTWKKEKKKQGNKECHCDCAARSYCSLVISLIWSFQRGKYGRNHTWWWQTGFLVMISIGLFSSLTVKWFFVLFFNLDSVIK